MDLSSDAVAVIGFVVLFALMLLRVPVGMAMGLVGVSGFGYIVRRWAGAEDGRPDLDADRYRLYVRRDPDVPADGRDRVAHRHEPGVVSGGQPLCRALAWRPGYRHDRGLRWVCRDQRILGGDGGDVLHRCVSGDAAVSVIRSRLPPALSRRAGRWGRCFRRPSCWRCMG